MYHKDCIYTFRNLQKILYRSQIPLLIQCKLALSHKLYSKLCFIIFYKQSTRVMWTPPLRESFSYPFLVFQLLAVTLTIKYVLVMYGIKIFKLVLFRKVKYQPLSVIFSLSKTGGCGEGGGWGDRARGWGQGVGGVRVREEVPPQTCSWGPPRSPNDN